MVQFHVTIIRITTLGGAKKDYMEFKVNMKTNIDRVYFGFAMGIDAWI